MSKKINGGINLELIKDFHSSKKIERDVAIAYPLLVKAQESAGANLTHEERMTLISIVVANYHEDGKIAGCHSVDSSCAGCGFCQKMRAAAEENPTIICAYCYDAAQERYKINAKERHCLNMAIFGTVLFTPEELAFVPSGIFDRINSSGDCPNPCYAMNAVNYAYAHKESQVAIWGKNIPDIEYAFDTLGKPENMRFIQSSIFINRKAERSKWANNTFTVYLTPEDIAEALANGSVECNGKKCRDCGYMCYRKDGWPEGADIAELFRGSKKTIAELKKLLSA